MLKEPNVLAACQAGAILGIVSGRLSPVKQINIRLCTVLSKELPDVKLDFTEEQERFGECLKLKTQVTSGYDADDSSVTLITNEYVAILHNGRNRIEQGSV